MFTSKAAVVWSRLNGIICVYKPKEVSPSYIINKIKSTLCEDLNAMETRPPEKYIDVKQSPSGISINVRPSYADNVLCVGPRYQPEDINVNFPFTLFQIASGVQVAGINLDEKVYQAIRRCQFTKCYHIKGVLGQASNDYSSDGKIIARAKYDHINKFLIDRILVSYQAANQRRIFQEYGFNLNSKEAYDLAISGLYRPQKKGAPILYSLKAVDVSPPDFTIEIQCIYDTEVYLKSLIHNLGVSLKCFATCSGIRCIRMGCFHIEHSLLKKHWRLEHILDNMKVCYKILEDTFPKTLQHTPTVQSART